VISRLPLLSTLIVAAAVLIMIALGIWQLNRAREKEALLARYATVEAISGAVAWPASAGQREQALYRRSAFNCLEVLAMRETAGRSADGQPGWAHVARCRLADGAEAEVALGWSREPDPPLWQGGEVAGFVAPARDGVRLLAAPAQGGLAQLAPPDPQDVPNNHLSYAVQWFFFAATAVVVYILALRRRRG
jgi:surfeit locus 1 family protein